MQYGGVLVMVRSGQFRLTCTCVVPLPYKGFFPRCLARAVHYYGKKTAQDYGGAY